jgi:hypothetical protein
MSIETDDSKNSDNEKQLINQEVNQTMNEIAAKIQKVIIFKPGCNYFPPR